MYIYKYIYICNVYIYIPMYLYYILLYLWDDLSFATDKIFADMPYSDKL